MAHARAQIRAEAVSQLGTAMSGATVRGGRAHSLNSETTHVFVYTPDEPAAPAGTIMTRALQLVIEIYLSDGPGDVDDSLDAQALLVENTLNFSRLGGLVKTCRLQRTETDFDGSGDVPKGLARLTYDVAYATSKSDPETVA